jgi:PAS domain S-box-containing protein
MNAQTNNINMENNVFKLTTRPTPSDRELDWDKTKILLSKTDAKGNILYANEAFVDVTGYDDFEIMDKSHNIIRHPDMPKVIFKLLWEDIKRGKNFHGILKNMSKTGRYFWVVTDYKIVYDENDNIASYIAKQKSISDKLVSDFIEPLYKKLLQIEQANGVDASENYLMGFLEERGYTYVEYIENLLVTGKDEKKKKKGFFAGLFSTKSFFAREESKVKKKK